MTGAQDLRRVMTVLGVTETELAGFFGTDGSDVALWLDNGIPVERESLVATVIAVVDMLGRKIRVDRVPAVVRRPSERFGGRSILEALAQGPAEVMRVLEDSFDWSTLA